MGPLEAGGARVHLPRLGLRPSAPRALGLFFRGRTRLVERTLRAARGAGGADVPAVEHEAMPRLHPRRLREQRAEVDLDFFGRRQAPSGSCFSQRQPSLPGNIRDRERERRRQQRSTGTGTSSHLTTSRQVSFLPGGKCRVAASLVAVSARNTALPFTSDAPMISNRSVCPVRSTTVIA